MPGRKKKNVYRKKRKGKPFTGIQRHAKKAKKMPPYDSGVPELVLNAFKSIMDWPSGKILCQRQTQLRERLMLLFTP